MKYEELKSLVENKKKGTICTIVYAKPLKTLKGVEDTVMKRTTMQVRTGVRYDNMKVVKEARENGMLPQENAGLANSLEWIDNNFIRNTKTGSIMLRVAAANGNKTITEYYKNGLIVDKSELEGICRKSELHHYATKSNTGEELAPTVFNIGVDKIISIK